MRIIAGKLRGRSIAFDVTRSLRPSKSRVRESLFNILSPHIEGAKVLDLFSGTGAIGLEFVSRGATHVTMVDKDVTWVKKNTQAMGVLSEVSIVRSDVRTYLGKLGTTQFDIVVLDPPYNEEDLYIGTLNHLGRFDILNPYGILVCEYRTNRSYEALFSSAFIGDRMGFQTKTYTYGNTSLLVVQRLKV